MNLDLEYWKRAKDQLEEVNKKNDQDLEIEDLNKWRKLPMEMKGTEGAFYSINKTLTLADIEETVREHLQR